jgi:hypothetical protein
MSWWTKCPKLHELSKSKLEEVIFYTEKNINLLRKNYDEINLITDDAGKSIFKHLKWSNIYIPLNKVSEKYCNVWSIAKLYAYQFLVQKNESFFHIDHDFFITKKLPENVESANILAQSIENLNVLSYIYEINLFKNECPNKYLANNIEINEAYNCGIIGGNDINFFNFYSETAIKMIEDKNNINFWLNEKNAKYYYTLPVLAEQYYLSASAKFLNRKVDCIFNLMAKELLNEYNMYTPRNLDIFKKTGCIHPFGVHNKDYLRDFLKTL